MKKRDKQIYFDEKEHKYFVEKEEFISVTTLISEQFEEVKYPLFDKLKLNPSERGKQIHAWIEKFFKWKFLDVFCDETIYFSTALIMKGLEMKDLDHDLFCEFNEFLTWFQGVRGFCKIFLSEQVIYDEEFKIAGTPDAVFVTERDIISGDVLEIPQMILLDWKCTKNIEQFSEKRSINPDLYHLMDCSFEKYKLQLSLYKYILEKRYDLKLSNTMYILQIGPHHTNKTIYQHGSSHWLIPMEYNSKNISILLESRMASLLKKQEEKKE